MLKPQKAAIALRCHAHAIAEGPREPATTPSAGKTHVSHCLDVRRTAKRPKRLHHGWFGELMRRGGEKHLGAEAAKTTPIAHDTAAVSTTTKLERRPDTAAVSDPRLTTNWKRPLGNTCSRPRAAPSWAAWCQMHSTNLLKGGPGLRLSSMSHSVQPHRRLGKVVSNGCPGRRSPTCSGTSGHFAPPFTAEHVLCIATTRAAPLVRQGNTPHRPFGRCAPATPD